MNPSWIIYKHSSTVSDKSYIGLTKRGINTRWSQHVLDAKNGSSLHFHNAIRLYGDEAWTHEILATNIPTLLEAQTLEKHFIRTFSTFEHGYNMTIGGDSPAVIKQKVIKCSIYNPTLDILELDIFALDFINKYGLNDKQVYDMLNGKHKSVKGWYMWVGLDGKYYRSDTFIFEHDEYGIEECTAGELSRKYGLYQSNVYKVVQGERTHTNGWKIITEIKE